ncbi:hypothetical protein [Micromonospora humi]|uniref:hypothetical protein n=1 Tax=Micromonospora humi TaxID=745366 RepID=UPI000B84E8ED|nr:hypothetical protein [Micromonospora humi]
MADHEVVRRALAFFGSHATVSASAEVPDQPAEAVLRCAEWEAVPAGWRAAATTAVTIRRSSAAAFNLHGLRGHVDGADVVVCQDTTTALRLRDGVRSADLYLGSASFVQLVEFVRDIVLKAAERTGAVQVHAACAARDGKAVAIVGAKGAGKSTMLLDLVGRHGFRLVSGDKILVERTDEGLTVRGWPDFPHLGVGTIVGHPALAAEVAALGHDLDAAEPQRKLLLDPEVLERAFGLTYQPGAVPLSAVVLPEVARGGAGELSVLAHPDLDEVMRHVERTADNRWMSWHAFRTSVPADVSGRAEAAVRAGLARLDWWRSTGRAPYPGADKLVSA